MAVTTTPIGVGAADNDGTGDPARAAGQTINSNTANLDAAVEELQSGKWRYNNTTETVAIGTRTFCETASVTKTLPAVAAISSTAFNAVQIINISAGTINVDANGSEFIVVNGASLGAGVPYTLPSGHSLLVVGNSAGTGWSGLIAPVHVQNLSDLDDTSGTDAATTGDVLYYDGTDFASTSREDADIVERDVPALEATPYIHHETLAARSSGTETIDCATQPSVYLPITGNNVTIDLDVPALSLPVRGLADVALRGYVMVYLDAAYTGLTVTTDAGTKLGTFPKGTAPSALGEYATLAWFWFDDGTTDFMWASWLNDA